MKVVLGPTWFNWVEKIDGKHNYSKIAHQLVCLKVSSKLFFWIPRQDKWLKKNCIIFNFIEPKVFKLQTKINSRKSFKLHTKIYSAKSFKLQTKIYSAKSFETADENLFSQKFLSCTRKLNLAKVSETSSGAVMPCYCQSGLRPHTHLYLYTPPTYTPQLLTNYRCTVFQTKGSMCGTQEKRNSIKHNWNIFCGRCNH